MDHHGKLLYAVDENPPTWMSILLGLQQVIFAFIGVVFVPVIVARGGNVPAEQVEFIIFASIAVSGISTLTQVVRFGKIGSGYAIFMGASGAFIACSLTAVQLGGFALVAVMSLLAAPLEFLFAYLIRHLRKIITPALGGVVIMMVAVNTLPIVMALWTGRPGTPGYCSVENLAAGLATLIVILIPAIFGGPKLRLWCPIIGLVAGYLIAWPLGILNLANSRTAPFFGLPQGSWPGLDLSFKPEYFSLMATFAVITLVGAMESMGTVFAAQKISERNFKTIDYDRVRGGLYADGLGNILAGLAGTIPNTTYSMNISVLELTGVSSRKVGIFGALIMGLLAFFPKLAGLALDIPGPVLGGCMVIFVGVLFATGLGLAASSGLNYENSLLIGFSLCVGLASEGRMFFHPSIPGSLTPFLDNGISTGGLTAFLLSLVLHFRPRSRRSLKLEADPALLPRLHDYIAASERALGLSGRPLLYLELACEEVFMHICRSNKDGEPRGRVHFTWTRETGGVRVEVEDRSHIEDVDRTVDLPPLDQAEPADLDKLGLALLGKVAQNVTHLHISGYNCISFNIPRE